MYVSPTHTARTLTDAGITIPAAARTALDVIDALRAAAVHNYHADVAHSVAAGKVTTANAAQKLGEHALDLLRAERVQVAIASFEGPLNLVFLDSIRKHADDLVTELGEKFAAPAAIVQTAGSLFPDGANAATVLAGGARAVDAWENLEDARATLDKIRNARIVLADIANQGEQAATWWIEDAADKGALDRASLAYSCPGNAFHNLAAAGFTLRLNDAATAAKIATGARVATETAKRVALDARLAEHRESWAPALAVLAPTASK